MFTITSHYVTLHYVDYHNGHYVTLHYVDYNNGHYVTLHYVDYNTDMPVECALRLECSAVTSCIPGARPQSMCC